LRSGKRRKNLFMTWSMNPTRSTRPKTI